MKHVIILSMLLIGSLGFAQNDVSEFKNIQLKNLGMKVTVNSAEEIEESIKSEDIRSFAQMTDQKQPIVLKLICKNDKGENVSTNLSYKVEGNTENVDGFLQLVEKVKKAANNYYNKS